MTDEVLFEVRNHVGFITLNRPTVLNSLSLIIVREMDEQLRAWARDPSVYAVLVKGAGEKAFCAGGDIRSVRTSIVSGGTLHAEFFRDEYRLDYLIHNYPKPYIAVMQGITMGGGMGISQGTRLRVVSDRTRIAMPETGIGFFPDVGGSFFLSRLPGALGPYLGLTGVQIGAADALYAGLADMYLLPEAVAKLDATLTSIDWGNDPLADIRAVLAVSLGAAPAPATLQEFRTLIDIHFSKPDVPAIIASLKAETRPEHLEWAQIALATLAKRSPLMLAVTLRQLQKGAVLSLVDCFRMELGMVHQCFVDNNFVEGVRALLVDKDNQPRWRPERLEDVTPQMVEAFFRARWNGTEHPLSDLEKSADM